TRRPPQLSSCWVRLFLPYLGVFMAISFLHCEVRFLSGSISHPGGDRPSHPISEVSKATQSSDSSCESFVVLAPLAPGAEFLQNRVMPDGLADPIIRLLVDRHGLVAVDVGQVFGTPRGGEFLRLGSLSAIDRAGARIIAPADR